MTLIRTRVGGRQWDALSQLAESYPRPLRAMHVARAGYGTHWRGQGMAMLRSLRDRNMIEHWPFCDRADDDPDALYRITVRGLTARRERRRRPYAPRER